MTVRALLSGGIGSGKSTVGELLAARGAQVIDADGIGHQVLNQEARPAVAERWPEVIRDGKVDRRLLGTRVFADPNELATLEELTHPFIRRRIHRLVSRAGRAVVIVQLPLLSDLLGEGWLRVVVDAPDETRITRLRERGMSEGDIRLRMNAQPTRAAWQAAADYVVRNSGNRDQLNREVDRLWSWLLESSREDSS